jgi:hypothetical protein
MWAIEGVLVLRLEAGQLESLWDEVVAVEVRELPEDLARIDALLGSGPAGQSSPTTSTR